MAALKATVSSDRSEVVTRLGNKRITSSIDTYETFATIEMNEKGEGWFRVKRGNKLYEIRWNEEYGEDVDLREVEIGVDCRYSNERGKLNASNDR